MLTKCDIILIVFVVLLVLMTIILIILRFTLSRTTTENITPTLQQLQTLGTIKDNIFVSDEHKPFSIYSRLIEQSFSSSFHTKTIQTNAFHTNALIGYSFHVTIPCFLTKLCFLGTSKHAHKITICNTTTGEYWTYVVKEAKKERHYKVRSNDLYLVTQDVKEPIYLTEHTTYGIVTTVFPDDVYTKEIEKLHFPVVFEKTVYEPDVYDATECLSSQFWENIQNQDDINEDNYCNILYFHFKKFLGAMMLPEAINDPSLRTVFDVNLATGAFARFPPHFLNGMNITVPENGANVLISRGFALSQQNTTNIVVDLGLVVNAQTGINGLDTGTLTPNTWYSVYVIASLSNNGSQGLPVASLLSLGHSEPVLLPDGYEAFRRIGSVRTTGTSSVFDAMQQEGDSVSRTSFFTSDFSTHLFDSHAGPTNNDYVAAQLQFVPPTASRAIIDVRTQMLATQNDPTTPTNGVIRFRPRFATSEGIYTLGLQNQKLTYGQLVVNLVQSQQEPEIEFRIFAQQPGGNIPAGPFPDPLMITNFYIAAFFESL